MNAGPVAERVYENLRRLILRHGFCPGDKLDPNTLAEQLNASVTPIREALNILCGEQLILAHRSGGYYLPGLDEPALKDMYCWADEIASLAMRSWPPDRTIDWARIREREGSYPDRVAAVMAAIARASPNGEHRRATAAISARLHAIRTIESEVLPASLAQINEIEQAFDKGDRGALAHRIRTYHRRRIRVAAALVRAAYRPAKP